MADLKRWEPFLGPVPDMNEEASKALQRENKRAEALAKLPSYICYRLLAEFKDAIPLGLNDKKETYDMRGNALNASLKLWEPPAVIEDEYKEVTEAILDLVRRTKPKGILDFVELTKTSGTYFFLYDCEVRVEPSANGSKMAASVSHYGKWIEKWIDMDKTASLATLLEKIKL